MFLFVCFLMGGLSGRGQLWVIVYCTVGSTWLLVVQLF